MAVQTETRKFKVAEFYKLGEVGILSEDEPVELLDGQIMIMAPIGENHRTVVDALAEILTYQAACAAGRPVQYIADSQLSKEELARRSRFSALHRYQQSLEVALARDAFRAKARQKAEIRIPDSELQTWTGTGSEHG